MTEITRDSEDWGREVVLSVPPLLNFLDILNPTRWPQRFFFLRILVLWG